MSAENNNGQSAVQWRFFRAGDFDQVLLERGSDLLALAQLDKKLWAALSCPVHGLEFDSRTLALIDGDSDERIRAPEILQAIDFCAQRLNDLELVASGAETLPLELIDTRRAEGAQLAAVARRILALLGKGEAVAISMADVTEAQALLAQQPCNGDGIVPPAQIEDAALRTIAEELLACVGGELDQSGASGVSASSLERFFAEAAAYLAWLDEAQQRASLLPLGEATAPAAATLQAVRAKIDDYFVRCRLAAFDARAAQPLNRTAEDYAALAAQSLTLADQALAAFPLATIVAEQPLPLRSGLNPAWSAAIATFYQQVVVPLLGEREALREAEWRSVLERLAPHEEWQGRKVGAAVAPLGEARLRALLAGDAQARLAALIAADLAVAPEIAAVAQLERLVRYVRDLALLLRNFVSLADFYGGKERAIFQAGTLYLDQRSCELCIRVDDIARHATLAALSRTYLVYCECRRRGGSEKMNIAAAITAGDADGLMVGRNGLFIDRQGQDWDATVVRIIEHSISIRQAFSDPYKRLARFIGAQVEKMASSKAKSVDERMASGVESGAKTMESGKAAPAPFDVAKFAGIFAAIGLAIGAIGTAVAAVVTGLLSLVWWQIPLALGGVVLAISGPSMVLAWLKLKQRSLAPLLDANGWAVNTRARINIPFGASLTALARLPPGAAHPLRDPFAEEGRPWGLYLLLVALAAGALLYGLWRNGVLG